MVSLGAGLVARGIAEGRERAANRALDRRRVGLEERRLGIQEQNAAREADLEQRERLRESTQTIAQAIRDIRAQGRQVPAILAQKLRENVQIGGQLSPGFGRALLAESAGIIGQAQTPAEAGAATATQTLAEAEAIAGRELTPEERAERAGIASEPEESRFGGSLTGRTLDIMTRLAPAFARAELPPAEERVFLSAVTEFIQPRRTIDPDTGLPVETRPELPPFVRDALEQRGLDPANLATPQRNLQTSALGQPPGVPVDEGELTPAARESLETGQQTEEAAPLPDQEQLARQEATIAQQILAGNLTGPAPVLGRFFSRIPGLGIRAPQQTSAKSAFDTVATRLIKALQTNPKFAVAERKDVIKRLDISPGFIDNAQAFLDRLAGVDRTIEAIKQSSERILGPDRENFSVEAVQQAQMLLNAIELFRSVVSPPIMQTQEEAERFAETHPPGTPFLAKDEDDIWHIWRVTGDADQGG